MKIGVFSHGNIPSYWAHSINTVEHAQACFDLGHDVTIYSIERTADKRVRQSYSLSTFYGIDDAISFVTVPTHTYTTLLEKVYQKFLEYIIYRFLPNIDPEYRLVRLALDVGVDRAYARTYRAAKYLLDQHIPTIIETHAINLKKTGLKQLIRTLKRTDTPYVISTISTIIADAFESKGIERSNVVVQEDAVRLVQKQPSLQLNHGMIQKKEGVIDVVYTGSLHPGKGIEDLLTVAQLCQEDVRFRFIVVGGPKDTARGYAAEAKEKGLYNIIFVGPVVPSQVSHYRSLADILIMLYNFHETGTVMDIHTTSPIKLFEYMAAGKPIIVSQIPAIQKVVTSEEVFFVTPGNVKEVVDTLDTIVSSPDMVTARVTRATALSKEYTYVHRVRVLLHHLSTQLSTKKNVCVE